MSKHFSKISVIGLGYVGLPLSFSLLDQVNVLGFDLDPQKVESINLGKSYLKHFSSSSIAER